MLQPLQQFVCDTCHQPIEKDNAYVIWREDDDGLDYDFRIVHHVQCDQRAEYPCSMPLYCFLGHDGLAYLTAFIDIGPLKRSLGQKGRPDFRSRVEFVDFLRRCQIPYYDEA